MKKGYRIAVVGATGMVGETFIKVLQERQFPIDDISFFASKRSVGKMIEFKEKMYPVLELNEHSFDSGYDFALFSAGGETSLKYAPIAASQGAVVIDNSSAWRMNPAISLIVPECNGNMLSKSDRIIANPNCSTIQSVVPLKVIDDLFGLKRVIYSSYQAVSGSGYKGLFDLDRGKRGESPQFYPKQIYDNCFPHIDDFLDTDYTKEEKKMIEETRKILGKSTLAVTATCVRIPVPMGHSVSINVECERQIDLDLLKGTFKNHSGIVFYDGKSYPTPLDASGTDLVHVGRLRVDSSAKHALNLWVVADNVRKGAATNAIQIAEHMIKEGLI